MQREMKNEIPGEEYKGEPQKVSKNRPGVYESIVEEKNNSYNSQFILRTRSEGWMEVSYHEIGQSKVVDFDILLRV